MARCSCRRHKWLTLTRRSRSGGLNHPPYPPCREGALLSLQAGPARIPLPFAGVSLAEALKEGW